MIKRPAPERAREPRWMRCQSVAEPSLAEYWHMGAMMIRLARRRLPICRGSKSCVMSGSLEVGLTGRPRARAHGGQANGCRAADGASAWRMVSPFTSLPDSAERLLPLLGDARERCACAPAAAG